MAKKNSVLEMLLQYDKTFLTANSKENFQTKISILQLREGEDNHNRRFISLDTLDRVLHEQPNCENYELIYWRNIETKAGTEQEREKLNNQLYEEFNADTLRPRNYYGHSLSMGDIVVISTDWNEQHSYYVDNIGFTKLPDNFLSREMIAKIRNNLDIRLEKKLYELYENAKETTSDRYFLITSNYARIFEMADHRGITMDMDELGYEPVHVEGFSDDGFLFWKEKNGAESFGFDGWELTESFVDNVHTLLNNYTVKELQDRVNGDYSVIEYGAFDDSEVQAAIKNYPQQDRPTLAEDITNIKGIDRQYNAGMRETIYTFECDVRGVHDILTYEVSRHDDGEDYAIHTENNDIWESMSEPELRKLEDVLSREATYFSWQRNIENAVTMNDLQDVRYGFMEAENLNLSQAQKEMIYDTFDRKEKEMQERSVQEMAQENEKSVYKYYFNQNALDKGSYPIENYEGITEYEEATEVAEINQRVWGELRYNAPLTEQQLQEFGLIPSPLNARANENVQAVYRPTTSYYEPELDLDGTAEDLFVQARNGYIENPDALHRLSEILTQENMLDEAERVGYMEEREREEDTSLYSVAQMKLDFMDGVGGIDDVSIGKGLNLSVMYEPHDNNVIVSLSRIEQDGNEDVLSTGSASMSLDEFKKMSRADFERFVNEVNYYNMQEQERFSSREREHEATKDSISYFVAEAMEFRNLGAVYDDIPTIEEAITVYENLSDDVRNMGNGIGVIVNGEEYSLYENGDVDSLQHYGDVQNNTEVLNAVAALKEHFHVEKAELNHGDNTKNPFNETNFKIQTHNDGFLVRSDSERFGENEVVYQSPNYSDCLSYISDRVDNLEPSYYVIEDLASWRSDVWENPPERSVVERFDNVDDAIAKFNEYRGMDYLKENITDNGEPMRRLTLGVSYAPSQMSELDLLHVENDKTLLLSDVVGERENGYEIFMTNANFIRDLNKIAQEVKIDEYSYYRDMTIEELAENRMQFLEQRFPNEKHTQEEVMQVAEEYIKLHPNYLHSHPVNERVTFADFTSPFLNNGGSELNHGEYENITLHIKYKEPINFNGFVVENDTITFGSQEELSKYVNGETTYDVLDNSVRKGDNEILLYAENEKGEVTWGVFPIEEFFRSDNGQIVEGSTIPALPLIEAGITMGHTDRSEVYSAVREFEQRNLVEHPVIDKDGRYEDKDFLYGAYDEYIARSHKQELSAYAERLNNQRESTLAEIYYGLRNGLTAEQIDQMIEIANQHEYNNDIVRVMRHGFQAGQSLEQVAMYSRMDSFIAEQVQGFVGEGASMEQLEAIQNLSDQGTAFYVISAMRDDGLNSSNAKIIVDGMADLYNWNEEQMRKNNPTEISPMDYEYVTSEMCEYAKEHAVTSDLVSDYLEQVKNERKYSSFIAYAESVNHRDNEQEELKKIVAEKSAPVEIDDTLPPKDQLKQRLENGVRRVLDSEQFKNWLSTGGKLFYNHYSFNNAMLIWLQKPDASYVMGYEKWKNFGRNVAQGATGAKVFVPLMANERYKGGLYRSIKSNLNEQLAKNPSLNEVSYRLGTSSLEFTMNRANHLVGFKVNGVEQQIFGSDDEAKRFIDRAIIGKVPTGFTVGTVFDAKDVIIPEYLWVKSGYTKAEIAPDEKGNPMKNRRGEVRIFNTPERQARFETQLDTSIVAKDPVKMQILFDACVDASNRKGVPVSLASKGEDETLGGGAKGYYSRAFSEENPNGFIVIDKDLEITEKCSVLMHEMGHADLHKNLDALAQAMGEEKISKQMREVQAEATAYSVASTFGIETDTSSFKYLAAYARGFELQDFQKSLDVIYKEAQALTKDIKAELDIRGFNLDLTEKPKEMLNKETLKTLSTKYVDFASEHGNKVQAALAELPSLIKQSGENPDLMEVLKYQKENLDSRKSDLAMMLSSVEKLNTADTREEQDLILDTLDAALKRVNANSNSFDVLSERYVAIAEQARGGLKVDFEQDPMKTLEAMKKDYPSLAKLSDPQLEYIAKSKFVYREFGRLLRDNPQEFVDKVTERAELISKAASKNGTFVEVNWCEKWTDKPFFEDGTLCSPKNADKILAGCEAQARGLAEEAEKKNEYFPYTKCNMTIFTPSKEGKLLALNTRVDIGDGAQASLKEHLEQTCQRGADRKEVLANFTEALSERAYKRQLIVQDLTASSKGAVKEEIAEDKNMSRAEWDKKIKAEKDGSSHDNVPTKTHDKNKQDRTE